jgi:hypothetical protein
MIDRDLPDALYANPACIIISFSLRSPSKTDAVQGFFAAPHLDRPVR